MTQRATLLVLAGVLLAAAASILFLTSAVATPRLREGPSRIAITRQTPLPTRRPVEVVQRQLPPDLRFLAPVVIVQRGISDTARDAAGLLLVLLLTSGTLVVARDQVVRAHAASAGDLRAQARVLGIGVGVLFAVASVVALSAIVALGALAGRPPDTFRFGLQLLFGLVAVLLLVVGAPALVGFSAAAWRVGVALLGAAPWRRLGERIPAPVAAVLGAALLYLAAQLPAVGALVAAVVLAYALGAFVLARLARPT